MSRGRVIAGVAAAALVAGTVLFAFAGRSGAAAQSRSDRRCSRAVTDIIYPAPEARGRPIVVIDAGHGGRDPGRPASRDRSTRRTDARARSRVARRSREARPSPGRDDAERRPLFDARRAGGGCPPAECRFVRLPAHGQRAKSAGSWGDRLFALRCRLGCRGRPARRGPERRRGVGLVGKLDSALLSDLGMQAQMRASADLAARLVGKAAGRVELRPKSSIASPRSTCFAGPKPRPCCSRRGTSATPTMRCCCGLPNSARSRARPCPGRRNGRRGARAPLTGFPHQPRQARCTIE